MSFRTILRIVNQNHLREARDLCPAACLSRTAIRRYPQREKIPDRANIRPAFWHDADRILHSKTYARYIDKTQVFYLFENDHITHRVLHVQLVAKIARLICRSLRLNEDLVEAISMGHDLGHVPYGHDGEKQLNKLCTDNNVGGFCHNAQSVRCLMELENDGAGRNLTLQVLDGILCHNGEIVSAEYRPNRSKNWVTFLEEYSQCQINSEYSKKIMPMTLEGCVMRISDVIAYIGRDIEDAIMLKVMTREELPEWCTSVLGNNNRDIINGLVMDLIENSYGREFLKFSPKVFDALLQLKDFNYRRIYQFPAVRTEAGKIQQMFKMLFEHYCSDLRSGMRASAISDSFLNSMSKIYLASNSPERIVVDFLAGMTDDFFNNQFKKVFTPCNYGYCLRTDAPKDH